MSAAATYNEHFQPKALELPSPAGIFLLTAAAIQLLNRGSTCFPSVFEQLTVVRQDS